MIEYSVDILSFIDMFFGERQVCLCFLESQVAGAAVVLAGALIFGPFILKNP